MTEFDQLTQSLESQGPDAVLDTLTMKLREQGDFHRLFDATMLKHKYHIGAPLTRPTSLDDVPTESLDDFKQKYIEAARETGRLFLEQGKIAEAWPYFRTIGETEPVARAIDAVRPKSEYDESIEELIQIALYEGAHPVKGLELLLRSHGTCNTVTAMDQIMPQLTPEQRKEAAAVLVDTLHGDLIQTIRYEVEQRMPMAAPANTIRELIAGREWLFENGNYHIDVSHLNAVVRFARAFESDSPGLAKALDLAEYGAHLDAQFQYPGDPPFDDFYVAHKHFFQVLADRNRDESLRYFEARLEAEPDEPDQQLIAYVLVDLYLRCGKSDRAIELAEKYLKNLGQQTGFSFTELCAETQRYDVLERVARESGDLVSFAAALVLKN